MKTSELQGAALDWAVAKCEGFTDYDHDTETMLPPRREYGRVNFDEYSFSTDWAQGGPIIEREWLDVTPWPNESDEDMRWQCKQHDSIDCVAFGPTPLIAAMRCYVASKLGDEVEIPTELLWEGVTMKTRELTGAALDWAVAKCEGHELESLRGGAVWYWLKCSLTGALEVVEVFKPSTDWAQGGPIIEREKIRIDCAWDTGPWDGYCKIDGVTAWTKGPTPLIAAMRCYVASKLGDEVEIPTELLGRV